MREEENHEPDDDNATTCTMDNSTRSTMTTTFSPTTDVYVTRHSARADRDERSRHWKPLPGYTYDDTQLSAQGEQATAELTSRLRDIPIRHIVSSPFLRCIQTVAPIATRKNLTIKVEPGICEVLLNSFFPPGFQDTDKLFLDKYPVDLEYEPVIPREKLRRERGDTMPQLEHNRLPQCWCNNWKVPFCFVGMEHHVWALQMLSVAVGTLVIRV